MDGDASITSGGFNWIGGFSSIGGSQDWITDGIKGSINQEGWEE